MSLSAKQVVASEKKRENAKKEYYKALLEQFCRKIKMASELGSKEALLEVPTFLVGFPKYDLGHTMVYMGRQLTRLGYVVTLAAPLTLKARWYRTANLETELEKEEADPATFRPSLVNLQKTANQLRIVKKGK
jgi:hypothetical protein